MMRYGRSEDRPGSPLYHIGKERLDEGEMSKVVRGDHPVDLVVSEIDVTRIRSRRIHSAGIPKDDIELGEERAGRSEAESY